MLQQLNKAFILTLALIGMHTYASAIINIEDLRQEGEAVSYTHLTLPTTHCV